MPATGHATPGEVIMGAGTALNDTALDDAARRGALALKFGLALLGSGSERSGFLLLAGFGLRLLLVLLTAVFALAILLWFSLRTP